jgi:hypothetical protein
MRALWPAWRDKTPTPKFMRRTSRNEGRKKDHFGDFRIDGKIVKWG